MSEADIICNWTVSARMCYKRKCKCKGCFYNHYFSDTNQKCYMKQAVKKSLEVLGKPKEKNKN